MRGRARVLLAVVVGRVVAAVVLSRVGSSGRAKGLDALSPPDAAAPPSVAPAAAPAAEAGTSATGVPSPREPSGAPASAGDVLEAFRARRSGVEVQATGVVARRLADDRKGLPHERFILRVGELTVLVAHNTELAPHVPVAVGDTVEVRGEYEWTQLGGVIHWTHRDPDGRHAPGWIRLRGRVYE